ncbi:MAG TPA: TIGR03067 domain-containing protein [Gemmataceae bacterium]|jgi:uncharacterized protein (TIGR03067 family)|nr:TIGR03067 domain-containing protein [Gemmataceae bacterium]
MTPLLLSLALTVAAPGPKDKDKPAPTLEGTWKVEKLEGKGDKEVTDVTFTFTADKVSIKEGGKERKEEAAYAIDPTKKPAHIDIKPGTGKDMTVPGIFEIDGDTLKICFRGEGGERPTEFKADPTTRTVLVVLKRAKGDK